MNDLLMPIFALGVFFLVGIVIFRHEICELMSIKKPQKEKN